MSAYRWAVAAYLTLILLVSASWVVAQTKTKGPIRRAQPPKFSKADPFFDDAFATALQGERPDNLGKGGGGKTSAGNSGTPASAGTGTNDNAGSGWAAIISPTALEDEIKAQKLMADANVTTPSEFAGSGYKNARRDFTVAAMVFGIIGEYDGDVRWKKEAPTERDVFARTAANAKVGTTGVYNEAKLRKADLGDLIGGQSPALKDAEPKAKWGELINRTPLMQRLDISRDTKIKAWTASAGDFKDNVDKLAHEAQIFAAIGTVLQKDGLESADDAEYRKFATMLATGGKELAAACKEKNLDNAGKAANLIVNSCEKCHEVYR
jgi:hypothetical protein